MIQEEVLTRHFATWQHTINWWVEGFFGAVNVQAMLMPNFPGVESSASVLGWIRTDAGWLFGSDVGYHHRFVPADSVRFIHQEDCMIMDGSECWYDGSTLRAEQVMKDWHAAQFDDDVIYAFCEQNYREEFG